MTYTTTFRNAFPCTEDELKKAESMFNDLVLNQNFTSKQAIKQVESAIKSERSSAASKKKELAKQEKAELVSAEIKMWSALNIECNPTTGKPENLTQNFIALLNSKLHFKEEFWWNLFDCQMYYGSEPINDAKFAIICNYIENTFRFPISDQRIKRALYEITWKNPKNPVCEYLNSVKDKWDQKCRIPTMFSDFLGAEDRLIYKHMAVKFMIAAVKRAFEPGCKFDYMLIFAGPQGIGKSNFCEKLSVCPEWYCDKLSLGTKDAYEEIRSSWIVNMDEIASLNKKDAATAKNFLTGTADKFRESYGHFPETPKRHCVFVGTTNEENFLKDTTSLTERRYWVIECRGTRDDSIERHKKLTPDYVDQLWAEAMHYYATPGAKDSLYIKPELWEEFVNDQKRYKIDNDSDWFVFLDDALNRNYVDFSDNSSLSMQYRSYGVGVTGTMHKQDIFIRSSLDNLLRDNHVYAPRGYMKMFADMRSEEWEYKVIKSAGKSFRALVRIKHEEVEKPKDEISALFEV